MEAVGGAAGGEAAEEEAGVGVCGAEEGLYLFTGVTQPSPRRLRRGASGGRVGARLLASGSRQAEGTSVHAA